MNPRAPIVTRRGVLQQSIPFRPDNRHNLGRAMGLNLTAVVVATYVIDDPQHPVLDEQISDVRPVEVFCDVLVYSNLANVRTKFLPRVRVMQPWGGMHNGPIWKPRPTSFSIADQAAFNSDPSGNVKAINPANLDGDHVVISFLNDSLDEPFISGGISHPSVDEGGYQNLKGYRRNLVQADGDPFFIKHHGSFFGVDDSGDYRVSTIGAYNGKTGSDGYEPDQNNANGNQTYELPEDATFTVVFKDGQGDRTASPSQISALTFDKGNLVIEFQNGSTLTANETEFQMNLSGGGVLTHQDGQFSVELGGATLALAGNAASATLTLGNGAVHPVIGEQMAVLWGLLLAWLDSHPALQAPPHPGGPASGAAPWLPSYQSTKISMPPA